MKSASGISGGPGQSGLYVYYARDGVNYAQPGWEIPDLGFMRGLSGRRISSPRDESAFMPRPVPRGLQRRTTWYFPFGTASRDGTGFQPWFLPVLVTQAVGLG